MNISKYQYFVCPVCNSTLELDCKSYGFNETVISGGLKCAECNVIYPIIKGIPRFVNSQNYATSFGVQWKLHSKTQIDKFNGTTISKDRFYRETGWNQSNLHGKKVLECGSGAGRFTQVVLDAGAICFSFDYSNAIEVNQNNNSPNDNLILAQADIYHMPFRKNTFDYIFCLGVLQHTPDVRKAFLSMVPYLKDGGEIVVDAYTKSFKALIHPKYLLRLVTTKMDKGELYKIIKISAPFLLSVSSAIKKIPFLGKYLSELIPIANYKHKLDIPDSLLLDLAILDTFDWLSPAYDQPQTKYSLKRYFFEAGLVDININDTNGLVGKGKYNRIKFLKMRESYV